MLMLVLSRDLMIMHGSLQLLFDPQELLLHDLAAFLYLMAKEFNKDNPHSHTHIITLNWVLCLE